MSDLPAASHGGGLDPERAFSEARMIIGAEEKRILAHETHNREVMMATDTFIADNRALQTLGQQIDKIENEIFWKDLKNTAIGLGLAIAGLVIIDAVLGD